MQPPIKQQPLVTVMMTSYNRSSLLGEAIESVLNQNYSNWELLVLDDASTDNSAEVIEGFAKRDQRVVYSPASNNLGITKNRNRGFAIAKGKYIAVLDSDDLWIDTEKLAQQVAFLESHPNHVLVGTMVRVINEHDKCIGHFYYETKNKEIRNKLLLRNQFTHSAVLWRRPLTNENNYDESLPIWEDYELILRLGKTGKLANLDKEMTAYRKHSSNVSESVKKIGTRTHLDIIKLYRSDYPNYFIAKVKGWLRFLV